MHILVDGEPTTTIDAGDPLLLGAGTFTTMRTYGAAPWRLDAHLGRLENAASWLGIPWSDRWPEEVERALEGEGDRKVQLILSTSGRRVIRVAPLDPGVVGRPVRARRLRWQVSADWPARWKLTTRSLWGPDGAEWLRTDSEGRVLETDRGNVLILREGVIWTAPDDGRILAGVTRECLLALACDLGIPVREDLPAVEGAEESYVCSTLKGLAPLVEIDGEASPGWGPVGRSLARAWDRVTRA